MCGETHQSQHNKSQYLLSIYFVPASVLDSRDTMMNKINKILALLKVLMGRKLMMNKYKKINEQDNYRVE